MNMDCFSCHDGAGHADSINLFLASKTRAEFHQQAAFFGNMRRIVGYSDRVLNVSDGNSIMDDLGSGLTPATMLPSCRPTAVFRVTADRMRPAFI